MKRRASLWASCTCLRETRTNISPYSSLTNLLSPAARRRRTVLTNRKNRTLLHTSQWEQVNRDKDREKTKEWEEKEKNQDELGTTEPTLGLRMGHRADIFMEMLQLR